MTARRRSREDADSPIPSRSQRRRDYLALHALGESLVGLGAGHLARLPLTEALRAAVREARRLEGGAYRRQMRYIARLISRDDPQALRSAMEYVSDSGPAAGARRRRREACCERLLAGGDDAIQALIEEHPGADRQRLRRLVRAVRAKRAQGEEGGREARSLLALLRELDIAALPQASRAVDDEP